MDITSAIAELSKDNLLILAFPVFILAVLAELYYEKIKELELYKGKDFWVSFGMAVITLFVEFIPKALAFVAFYYIHEWSPFKDIVGRQFQNSYTPKSDAPHDRPRRVSPRDSSYGTNNMRSHPKRIRHPMPTTVFRQYP